MLWTVINLWPSGARFVLNCYCHWSLLVLKNGNGTASFLHSKESVTQGDPLVIIADSIGILPLIKNLKQMIPDVTQPSYADDARTLGTFTRIEKYLDLLTRQVPGHG